MSIADILKPCWDQILVRRDPPSDIVGVGIGGFLVAPETGDTGRCHTGLIVSVGEEVHRWFQPGMRVVFAPHAATVLGKVGGGQETVEEDGKRYDIVLILQSDVICVIQGDVNSERQLDASWMDNAVAPPGQLLVERCEEPVARGRIILTDHRIAQARSAEAVITSVSPYAEGGFEEGDGVLLGSGVGRSVGFGFQGERRLYRASPRQIRGRLLDRPDRGILPEESPLKYVADVIEPVDKFDEGDPRTMR